MNRFDQLLEDALAQARRDLRGNPDVAGGLNHFIDALVMERAACRCPRGQYPDAHAHCASCAERIAYDGDAPYEIGGHDRLALPDGARTCAGACELELHDECADADGLCILCHLERYPSESASDDRELEDIFSTARRFAPVEDPRLAELRVPTVDVHNARCALSTFWLEHVAACNDPAELACAVRDLDELVELVGQRRKECAARLVALTNRSLEIIAA